MQNEQLITFSRTWDKEIVEVIDDLASVGIWIVHNWLGNTDTWHWTEGSHPFAVHIDTILDGLVLRQRQRKPIAQDIHAPEHLKENVRKVSVTHLWPKFCFFLIKPPDL